MKAINSCAQGKISISVQFSMYMYIFCLRALRHRRRLYFFVHSFVCVPVLRIFILFLNIFGYSTCQCKTPMASVPRIGSVLNTRLRYWFIVLLMLYLQSVVSFCLDYLCFSLKFIAHWIAFSFCLIDSTLTNAKLTNKNLRHIMFFTFPHHSNWIQKKIVKKVFLFL